jgi:CPA1 family monovalent cation:H+ antiporter
MENFKIIMFIMVILVGFTALTNNKKLPYPILLIFAGLVIGFIPALPNLALDPDVVFILMLPPLLYDAASKTSWHEFRTAIRPISALAITLVFFTTLAVAVTAHYLIDGFSWPLAFVLGAVVSPPDAVAASGIIKGLGLNKRVVTILEGESLVNDASALIAYRYAVTAVTTGSFVLWQAGLEFLWVASAGILIGIAMGYLFVESHRRITNNPVVETCFTLLAPFLSYLAAEQLHVSGVLAVVCTGLVIAWKSPEVFSYQARMRTRILWDTLIFLLHGFVFIMIGLQLPAIVKGLGNYPFTQMLGYGLLISLVTIVVRFIWVFAGVHWQTIFRRTKKEQVATVHAGVPDNTWKNVLVVAWTGTRGVISLAAALALPLFLQNGQAFPQRAAIIFMAFVVIIVTLVVQGLTLPLLIRWLKITPEDYTDAEQKELELYLASHTVHYIEHELRGYLNRTETEELLNKYQGIINELTTEIRRHKQAIRANAAFSSGPADALQNAKTAISKYQRTLLLKMHKEGLFSDAAIRKVERTLDINELKLNKTLSGKEL